MDCKVFGVLLWKHWCVRKRKKIITIFEYFIPIVLFVLLFVMKGEILSPPSATRYDDVIIHATEPLSLDSPAFRHETRCILFTPDTKFTRSVMEIVGKKLALEPLEQLPDPNERGYYAFKDFSEISNFTKSDDMSENDAVIIFETEGDATPERLKYTIRMKKHFMTQMDTAQDGLLHPHMNFGTIYESFMRVQWAIDTSFAELRTGKEITQNLTLQEFPYAMRATAGAIELIATLMMFCFFFSLLLTFTLLVGRLVAERVNGVQELMKMSGVSTWLLGLGHFVDALPGLLAFSLSGAILLTVGSPALLQYSSGLLLFIGLLLHGCSMVAFGFVCGYLLRSLEYLNTLVVTLFVGLAIASDVISIYVPKGFQLLFCLVPGQPSRWLIGEIETLEKYGTGLTFKTMMTAHGKMFPSAFVALVFMALQLVLFMLLAWYLDHVCPGKMGLALPWDFFCKKQFWRKNDVVPDFESEESEQTQEQMTSREEQFFEPPPAQADVGIKAANITKIFPKHRALNNVSLDVYKGELTVLLGHNGAGKTTLMSIMTGTMNPTIGKVFINGQDIMRNPNARKQIGFCPQHNMSYPQLSVLEHVILFSMLRGQSRAEAVKSSRLLVERLGLEAKADVMSSALSGGMRRRLQMACALAGAASVVVLDEPSAGLDVETRRGLWDLVLSLRGDERTVLISTHFMEEADALGDRVAALHSGLLRCHATPMYLKKAIGTGYRLTFTTVGAPKEAAIAAAVRNFVPDATVKEVSLNSISLALPATSSGAFPALFTRLEADRAALGIDSIGVGVSTLEEVFLQLCSDVDTASMSADEVDGVSRVEPTYTHTRGCHLYLLQFFELIKRQIFYILHKKYSFVIWQVIIPIVIVAVSATQLGNMMATGPTSGTARALNVGMYGPGGYRVLYRADGDTEGTLKELGERYPDVRFERADNVYDAVLRTGIRDAMDYQKYIAGIEINETDAKVLYTTTLKHAAPAALNLLANVLARRVAPPSAAAPPAVEVVNHPLDRQLPVTSTQVYNHPKDSMLLYMLTFFIAIVLLFNLINAAHLPIMERISGARHMHVMAGCPPELHWGTTIGFRATLAVLTFIVPVVIILACDKDRTLSEPVFLGAWFMLLLLSTLAFLSFVYVVSMIFNQLGCNTLLSVCIFVNMICFGVQLGVSPAWRWTIVPSQHVFPAHTALQGLIDAAARAHTNARCALNRHLCPAPPAPGCCDTTGNLECMFCLGSDASRGPGYSMLVLFLQFVAYTALLFAMQRGLVKRLVERLKAARYSPPPLRYSDEMVRAERAYVSKAIDLPARQISDVMLVSNVHKVHNLMCKRMTAIRGINFSVKKGECLGLLGVNGAGKSSTFRVLTAEDWPTRGEVFAAGEHRRGYSTKYMQGLGYCPQFFGLDDFLTGRQNLRLLLTLKGLNDKDATTETNSWIKIVGLEKYTNRKVVGYSGGCQRRMAAAAALAVGAPLTLLDEPTAGVDVSARRRVWAALRRGLAHTRAVIITSHSMDEMEALCHRIAIMSGGEICALGSPAALRAAHAAGHAVVIKVKPPPATPAAAPSAGKRVTIDETDASSQLNRLKGSLREKFDCTLKDEHRTMLHYHINETMQYSQIFQEMERLKNSFPDFVEDYSVTETTLEEVFLSFAKRPEETDAPGTPSPEARNGPESRAVPV